MKRRIEKRSKSKETRLQNQDYRIKNKDFVLRKIFVLDSILFSTLKSPKTKPTLLILYESIGYFWWWQ